jgi:rhodanese-related sulfurtransferase
MDKVSVAVLVAIVLALVYFVFLRGGDITGGEARKLVQDGARLVDVRSPAEFAAGHIDGALNIPVQELERRMAELEPQNEPIVLYCRSGNRSRSASRLLKSAGYTAVSDLGAMSRW